MSPPTKASLVEIRRITASLLHEESRRGNKYLIEDVINQLEIDANVSGNNNITTSGHSLYGAETGMTIRETTHFFQLINSAYAYLRTKL